MRRILEESSRSSYPKFEEKRKLLTNGVSTHGLGYIENALQEAVKSMGSLHTLREEIAALRNVLYFNWGGSGPSPERVVEKANQTFRDLNDRHGPMSSPALEEAARLLQACRIELAQLLGCDTEEIALMESTSDGINRIASGLAWEPGDEVILSDEEHISGIAPWLQLASRLGIRVIRAPVSAAEGDPASILEQVTPRTRLVFLSHVSYKTGTLLPLRDIAKEAERRGFLVGVDGAQAVGQFPVSLPDLGVHFYALPGQKWLLGPDGTGALFVRNDVRDQLMPSAIGWASLQSERTDNDQCEFHPSARRFEIAGRFVPAFAAFTEAIRLIRQIGIESLQARIRDLTKRFAGGLETVPNARLFRYNPKEHLTGLIAMKVEGADISDIVRRLWNEHKVVCRWIDEPRLVRFSIHAFNTESEIDQAVDALRHVLFSDVGS